MKKHIHVVPSVGVGASIETDHEEWLNTGQPCILCGESVVGGIATETDVTVLLYLHLFGDTELIKHEAGHRFWEIVRKHELGIKP